MSGPPRKPTAWRRMEGNRGKRGWNHDEPAPPEGSPDCPEHLSVEAQAEWYRLVKTLVEMGVITTVDRAVLAAYCQAWGRWVEAEEKLKETPLLIKTPSGYVQQSPWLGIANRQMELMGRYMAEIGLTPASRSRITVYAAAAEHDSVDRIEMVMVWKGVDGVTYEAPFDGSRPAVPYDPDRHADDGKTADSDAPV
ncbi:MAG: phage terminase small subunit P27 family [Tabrizicola sp.]|nr:phage terminase small subunit P27 family [Tabrizicola sp.]